MTTPNYTLGRLIDLAMQMERTAYDFYDKLETQFHDNVQFVECVREIKGDEQLHLRVLTEIKASLSALRLGTKVDREPFHKLETILAYMAEVDVEGMEESEEAVTAIRTLEGVEFDVVMNFIHLSEIGFEFTREYLKNESVDHTNRIYKALQALD